jgi:membrane associated rhomboid family serine protease
MPANEIMSGVEEILPPDAQKTLEWITALAAAGLDYELFQQGADWTIRIPSEQLDAAVKEIGEYERVNVGWPPTPAAGPRRIEFYRGWNWAAIWGSHLVLLFYIWLGHHDGGQAIFQYSCVRGPEVMRGEWWRLLTALTVHSDVVHLASNLFFMMLFSMAVCRTFGGGLGWLLILVGGAAGNAATVLALEPEFSSVGASTACFAALGIVSVSQSVQNLRRSGHWRSIWSRAWIPLAAGVAVLSVTGAHPGSNVTAHLFGFLMGVSLALPFSWSDRRWIPTWAQRLLAAAAAAMLAWAWWKAILAAGMFKT